MQGLVLSGANNFFAVRTPEGNVVRCSIKGKKLKESRGYYNPLAPGDTVDIEYDTLHPDQGQITALIPRRNGFIRWNQKTRSPQLLAANIDLLLCVTTPANPPFRPRFTDRTLVQAAAEGIPALIIVNKIDLGIPESVRERIRDWQRIGIQVCEVSAKTGEGLEPLARLLSGKTCAVTGQSGVGKSSLLNSLDSNLALKTADISFKYDRGIHTTTQGVFLPMTFTAHDGTRLSFNIIDTPGIRHFALWGIKPEEVIFYFPEMEAAAIQCAFGLSCSHIHERGCRILEELDAGHIHPDRYESWRSMHDELALLTADEY
ncbi:ribosome small subunit-dependent GTPase A [Treponema medium]|uniref:Small ribosomal subunit biogenesis GTPase RsgA n=2 Tax=Treponema medium TaxID=58231 RepID=A0AA87NMN2_TREMD|nr:ribosome small subunit-dependent GTPase A [Treponema medium]EPF29073.1 ribosome small subunit-dependent GTPase A [Treponema medium ATCC 700293]QSH97200.1 ribosome small subunit-dependent GTPase A [Treponema medium]